MSSVILFGGSGFVGTHLQHMLADRFERVYIADIRDPQWHCRDVIPANPRSVFVHCDVRTAIDDALFGDAVSHIVNLAAVHTSPGHPSHEYFEANILGAQNICAFAERRGIDRVIFTSSISVYGPGEDEKSEDSIPMPMIPYGSSKIVAEYIHREWLHANAHRKLSIIRPGVIFGVGEGGNFTRIANALEMKLFAYPGRKDTIKACVYVKDICRYIIEKLDSEERFTVHNFCYSEKITIQDVVKALKRQLGYRCLEPVVPLWLALLVINALSLLKIPVANALGLDPRRLLKLVHSTNISSRKLIESGFEFKYPLSDAIRDWARECGGRTLY